MTSSLGTGNTEDSSAIRNTIPGYPRSRKPWSNPWISDSSIETVLTHEGDEEGRTEWRVSQAFRTSLDQRQRLGALIAEGNQQPPAQCELLDERRRDLRPTGRDENRVVRRVRAPSQRSVAEQHGSVLNGGLAQGMPRGFRQLPHALHTEHLGYQISQ